MGCQMVNGNKLNDWSSESSELDRTQQWGYPIPIKEYLLLLLLLLRVRLDTAYFAEN